MKYLKDNQYPVISLRDVAKYVDAAKTTQLLAYRHTQVWGGVTKKDNRLYLCVDHLAADRKLTSPDLTTRITKAWMLADDRKNPLTIIKADSGLQTIVVPEFSKADYGDSPVVVVAELKGDPITTITDFVIPGLPAATIAKNGILVNVPLATDLTKLAPVYRTGSPPVTTSSTTCTSSIASELPIPLEPSTMNHLITNHRAPSVQIFRKLRMLCLLPLSMVALSAAEEPPPPVVDPGAVPGAPPSDAIVLFDGKDLSKFRGKNSDQPKWTLANGVMETIPGGDGNGMFSREEFGDCQLHVEWASPAILVGEGQTRGNSGVFMMGRYEIQVLDSYQNKTYPNGQCGAFYGHNPPLVNACRKPGEWQAYDIIFHAPKRLADGKVQPGSYTVLHNGVLIQDHIPVGEASTASAPLNGLVEKGPLYLQEHGCKVRFRNVWVRKL